MNTENNIKTLIVKKPLKLDCGKTINEFPIAYETYGSLGADYIQLYTGMVFQGPNIAGSIKKELKELLIRDGVKNFTEIIGNKTLS